MVRRPLAAALSAALLGSGLFLAAAPLAAAAPTARSAAATVTKAAPKPRVFKNCTELNKVYKHGVGRKGARDRVTGKSKPVTNWTVNTAVYNANKKSDRDKGGPDGIACEKK